MIHFNQLIKPINPLINLIIVDKKAENGNFLKKIYWITPVLVYIHHGTSLGDGMVSLNHSIGQ